MNQQAKIVSPKCQGDMKRGVSQTFIELYWYEAPLNEKGRFSLSRKNRRRVYTYRCATCGFLEPYAN